MARFKSVSPDDEVDDDVLDKFEELSEAELIDFEKRCFLNEVQSVADDLDDMIVANRHQDKPFDSRRLQKLVKKLTEAVKNYS